MEHVEGQPLSELIPAQTAYLPRRSSATAPRSPMPWHTPTSTASSIGI